MMFPIVISSEVAFAVVVAVAIVITVLIATVCSWVKRAWRSRKKKG